MIQRIAQDLGFAASRRVLAVLLAVFLNLALVPCTMAVEVVEEGHDCCPPELKLETSECCEVDDISIDARGIVEPEDLPDFVFAGVSSMGIGFAAEPSRYYLADPPDPPGDSASLHKRLCIYLI